VKVTLKGFSENIALTAQSFDFLVTTTSTTLYKHFATQLNLPETHFFLLLTTDPQNPVDLKRDQTNQLFQENSTHETLIIVLDKKANGT